MKLLGVALINKFIDLAQAIILPNENEKDSFPEEVKYKDARQAISKRDIELSDTLDLWCINLDKEDSSPACIDLGVEFASHCSVFAKKLSASGYDKNSISNAISQMRTIKTCTHTFVIKKRKAEKLNQEKNNDTPEETLSNNSRLDLSSYNIAQKETVSPIHASSPQKKEGISEYRPLNINNTYTNGFLYYPVQILVGQQENIDEPEDEEQIKEHIKTVVIRSDRTIRHAVQSDAPDDAEKNSTVFRLDDGILINGPPKANSHGTWEWASIEEYLEGNAIDIRLEDLLIDIHTHLYSKVWLPNNHDYWMLALACVASYVQNIFDSVPLFLLNGLPGTGKSELGNAMSSVSCNSVMIGQVSPATMARLINESSGLAVIDDLESIGGRAGKSKGVFSEMAQTLKMSYKKSTAVKAITDPKTQRSTLMNFYGIKVLSNTTGSDSILGSRLFKVSTLKMPEGTQKDFLSRTKYPEEELSDLRNRCHSWGFEHVDDLSNVYMKILNKTTTRSDEIAAPLRAIALLSGNEKILSALESAISKQEEVMDSPSSKEDMVKEAIRRLAKEGYKQVSPTHVELEMRTIVCPGGINNIDDDIPNWIQPEWIGRQLRNLNLVSQTDVGKRVRLHGKSLRVITLEDEFISKVNPELLDSGRAQSPLAFCGDCDTCPYLNHKCDLKIKKKKSTSKKTTSRDLQAKEESVA